MSVNEGMVFVMKTTQGRIKERDHCDCGQATFTTPVTEDPHNPQRVMGFVNIVNVASFLFPKEKKREKSPVEPHGKWLERQGNQYSQRSEKRRCMGVGVKVGLQGI